MKKLALKNFLLVLLLFIEAGFAQAQDNSKSAKDLYLSYFGNDSTSINISYVPCCSGDLAWTIVGIIYNRDTIRINDKLYLFSTPKSLDYISSPEPHYLFPRVDTLFLREERETGRLYRYYRDYFGTGEAEKLISDMSLEEGDRFVILYDCLGEHDVAVSRVEYNNGKKRIFLSGGSPIFREGIFPDEFPLWQEQFDINSVGECGSSRRSALLCEYKDGEQVYGFNNDCFQYVCDVEEIKDDQISIYPNMVIGNDIITIESVSNIHDVIVIDIFGKNQEIITDKNNDYKWQIEVSNKCNSGIHFIVVKTDKGVCYEKVIVSH